jgi:hypothetical protein
VVDSKYGTSGGVELTDELIERLAGEAEEGYDVERLRPRSRRGRPPMGSEAAALFQVRLEPELRASLMRAAHLRQTSPSEVARRALRAYLGGAVAPVGAEGQPRDPVRTGRREMWSIDDIRRELGRYGELVNATSLAPTTKSTYLADADRFVRWLAGEIDLG